ncbi:MAG: helix-turn-helix transcriptional regulator [Spirochaetia bacterium]
MSSTRNTGYELITKGLLLETLGLIRRLRSRCPFQETKNEHFPGYSRRDRSILAFIHTNYLEEITAPDTAAAASLSPNYFSTYFRETFGVSFTDYITKLRILKSMELLLQTDQTIPHIAFSCGFRSVSNFYTCFKKYTEKTPKQLQSGNFRC